MIYTIPQVKKVGKRTFVEFYYNKKRYRYSFNLNRIKDENERNLHFNIYRKKLQENLENGWSPDEVINKVENQNTLIYLFKKGVEIKNKQAVSNRTYTQYKLLYDRLINSIENSTIAHLPIEKVTRRMVYGLLEQIQDERKLNNRSYNNYLIAFKMIIRILADNDYINDNVLLLLKRKKKEEQTTFIPPTTEELKTIKSYLINNGLISYWHFLSFIFQSGLRINEILEIKIEMIDLDNRYIKVPAKFIKTKVDRYIAVDEVMLNFFNEINVKDLPSDYYLFGYAPKIIMPSPIRLKSPTYNERFRYIMRAIGLPHIKSYSFKYLSANKRIEQGEDIDAVKNLFGHTTVNTTKIYATKLKDIYLERQKHNKFGLDDVV